MNAPINCYYPTDAEETELTHYFTLNTLIGTVSDFGMKRECSADR